MSTARALAVAFALLAGIGCKANDPDWCESNNECLAKQSGKTMCDIVGRFGPANTCIRPDGGTDASDSGPMDVPRLDLRLDATPDGDDAPEALPDTDGGAEAADGDGGDA